MGVIIELYIGVFVLVINFNLSRYIDSLSVLMYNSGIKITNMYEQILAQAGLSVNQAAIYELLLKEGTKKAGVLAKNSALTRPLVYKTLEELVSLGLAKKLEIPGKPDEYSAEHPDKIRLMAESAESKAAEAKQAVLGTIPRLLSAFNLAAGKPGVRFYEGTEGLKKIYEDTLAYEKDTIYAVLNPEVVNPGFRKWLDEEYTRKRVIKNITARVIVSGGNNDDSYVREDKESLREIRQVPYSDFPVDVEINIYGQNKVSFISYTKSEMVGVVIESQAIHNSLISFFKLAWLHADTLVGKSLYRLPDNLRKG